MRAKVWLDVDPDRSGLVPSCGARPRRFATTSSGRWTCRCFSSSGVTQSSPTPTKRFARSGKTASRVTARPADWQLHLNTLFPDVRLKKTIEIRGADSRSLENAPALAALYAGIFYDDRALDAARSLVEPWTHAEVDAARSGVWRDGLGVSLGGKQLAAWAEQIIDIARSGLERRGLKDAKGRDERIYLEPISKLPSPAFRLHGVPTDARALRAAVLERSASKDRRVTLEQAHPSSAQHPRLLFDRARLRVQRKDGRSRRTRL